MKFATVEDAKYKASAKSSEIILILSIQEARVLQAAVEHATVISKDKYKSLSAKRLGKEFDSLPLW